MEKILVSEFERRDKTFGDSTLTHKVFHGIPTSYKVTENTKRGTRLMIAKYPNSHKIYFYGYILPGTNSYPRGAVKVWNKELEQIQYFYFESVAIHPSGEMHKFE